MGEFSPWHWLIVAIVAILIFGPKKLPELGKGLAEGIKGFKDGFKDPPPPPAASTEKKSTDA